MNSAIAEPRASEAYAQYCVGAGTKTPVATAGLADFDLAYAHEVRARALACLGRLEEAEAELAAARAVPIADDEDRQIVDGDLAAGPWFGLAATAAGATAAPPDRF